MYLWAYDQVSTNLKNGYRLSKGTISLIEELNSLLKGQQRYWLGTINS